MTSKGYICSQEDCALRNNRIMNHCEALIHAYENADTCPFYKSLEQQADESFKRHVRIQRDDDFRKLVEYYAAQGYKNDR